MLSIKVKEKDCATKRALESMLFFICFWAFLEMTSIKSTLDNSDANPQESDYLHCQFPSPLHTPPKFGIYEVREEKKWVSGNCLLQFIAFLYQP